MWIKPLGYKPPAYKERVSNGLCELCGLKPIDHTKRSKQGPKPSSNTCFSCRESKYDKYKNKPYHSIEKQAEWYVIVKRSVFEKYGGRCEICGEHRWECLTIDHINEDGKEERLDNGYASKQWFLYLNRESVRDDLRILCMSCNWSIAQWGYSALDPKRPRQVSLAVLRRNFDAKWRKIAPRRKK